MKKKILVIPSWLYYKDQPFGSYFIEQADFLNRNSDFEIKFLFGRVKSEPFFKVILDYLHILVLRKVELFRSTKSINTIVYEFDIPTNRRISDRFYLAFSKIKYQLSFKKFSNLEWIPDLIHCQSGMDAGIYAHLINKMTNVPFVIIEHQVFVFHYYSKLRSKLILDAFKDAKKTAAVSFDERRQVLMNQPNCNPDVIWNLVDESQYKIQLEKRNKVFTIITILNSLPIKGFDTFLETMAELANEIQDFKFIMIGRGADKFSNDPVSNSFVRKSKELGVYDFGEFIPLVGRDQISNILNSSHVFLSPTIQEPYGIAVREAMMCGLPVISTANGGVEDSIMKETGIVVPVKNPTELAKAIIEIKGNLSFYHPNKIRGIAIEQCGKNAFLKSMINFYNLS